MKQFLTLLPVLVLFTLCKPIVCPYGHSSYDRRDRAPYIDSNEHGTQQLEHSAGTIGSHLRKASTYKENNAHYRHQEQQVETPQIAGPVYNRANPATHRNHKAEITTVTPQEKSLRDIFATNFGPGLHLFDNTAPFVNQAHFNSYTDQMIGDQPDPYSSSSTLTPSDKEFFKVQRSPNGKLSLVYNDDYITKKGADSISLSSSSSSDSNENVNSNNSDSFENNFQTPFSGGLSLTNGKVETSTQEHFRKRENGAGYIVDTRDCIEGDDKSGKPFCTRLRNYPEQSHLDEIIKTRFNNLESFFNEDVLVPLNISQRMNNEPIEEFLCRSNTRVIYPEAGLNKESDWLFIINTKKYKQGVRIEECVNEGSVCGENTGLTLPNRYKAICRQNYIYRSLVAYTNETIVKDQFKMPSCCKCVLTMY